MKLRVHALGRRIRSPRMQRGYRSNDGSWRALTRVSDSVVFTHQARVEMGDNVYVGHYCILDGTGGLKIDEGVQLAGWNGIYTHSSHVAIRLYGRHYNEVPEVDKKGFHINPVKIGRYAFVGAGAIVLPGVSIGSGALVAAGSVVTDNINDFDVVAGSPAQVRGSTKDLDEQYLSDPDIQAWYEEWQQN